MNLNQINEIISWISGKVISPGIHNQYTHIRNVSLRFQIGTIQEFLENKGKKDKNIDILSYLAKHHDNFEVRINEYQEHGCVIDLYLRTRFTYNERIILTRTYANLDDFFKDGESDLFDTDNWYIVKQIKEAETALNEGKEVTVKYTFE